MNHGSNVKNDKHYHGLRQQGTGKRRRSERRQEIVSLPTMIKHDFWGETMAEAVPSGSDVLAGAYSCTRCGYKLDVDSMRHLPPCPCCGNGRWDRVTGGDSVNDPYPGRG
jgi:predicted RNA-binding Zn-ribbon protein involved in translation (DUF1610 family)